jgi:type II secretory pathway predicted ATPase ExeA
LYYPHFGLKEPPFKITPNTDFFFSGGNRGAILDALVYAITNGEGIIKVVGEVGSGKTMLCRMLQTILPEKIESIYLANPSVAPEDVLHAIAFELQLKLPKNADRLKVMQELQAYLLARYAEGRQVVIFVEEAQGMPLATLEEIRLLSNLETKQDKLLQIVLFGQPELDDNLNQEHIRQLRERITHRFNLGPLQTKDVGDYLIFRLRAAGYHGPHLFTESAIKKLSKASEGLVRRVNILADKALLSAFADNVYHVTPKHVHAAVNDSEFGLKPKWYQLDFAKTGSKHTWRAILLMAIAGMGILAAVFAYMSGSQPKPEPVASADSQPAKRNTVLPAAAASTADVAPTVIDMQQLLVNQRLQATDNLLSSASPETISLQIQSVPGDLTAVEQPQDAMLKTALEKLRRQLEMDNIYLYRMQQNDSVYTVILYGAFAQRADALNALSGLPAEIKVNQPYLRTLAGVKKDIELSQKIKSAS